MSKVKYRGVITLLFLALWLYLFASNVSIFGDTVKKLAGSEFEFAKARDELVQAYNDNLLQKYDFINLNGLYVRLSGGRVCNKMIRLSNGSLSDYGEVTHTVSKRVTNISRLYKRLKKKDIDFVYIQDPFKIDINNESLPYGATDETNANVNALLEGLEEEKVPVLDLRESISDTPEHVDEYFYKTDHHWNSLGAFKAFQEISEYLQTLYPDEKIYGEYQNLDNWDIHRKEKWSLGSRGKRTGVYFAGIDDLIWLTPKFETEMSFANAYKDEFYAGDYTDANVRKQYIESRDYFVDHAYCVYVGGNYPLIVHKNNIAPVHKKVLVLKDSFALPLETYLSTVFSELDTIDLREYNAGTLYEYILETEPDVVIMNYNPSVITKKAMFDFGIDDYDPGYNIDAQTLVYQMDELDIASDDVSSYKCNVLSRELEAGKAYRLECDSVEVKKGNAEGISIKVSDKDKNIKYDCTMWDIDYCTKNDSFEWTFTVPADADDPMLLIYSGIAGQTMGNDIVLKGLRLYLE